MVPEAGEFAFACAAEEARREEMIDNQGDSPVALAKVAALRDDREAIRRRHGAKMALIVVVGLP